MPPNCLPAWIAAILSFAPVTAAAAGFAHTAAESPNPARLEAPLTHADPSAGHGEECVDRTTERRPAPTDALKCIPLWAGGLLSLGGQLRPRYELVDPGDFGLDPATPARSVLLIRALSRVDLRVIEGLRVFAELGIFPALGAAEPAEPPDRDGLDVTQLHLESEARIGSARLSVRFGRQEMPLGSTKWIGVRDGTNVRQSFDLARATLTTVAQRLDVFIGGVPELASGSFDDRANLQNQFWGVYGTSEVVEQRLSADLFYVGRRRPEVHYVEAAGREHRHTLGLRLFGTLPSGFDYVGHALVQVGSLDGHQVRAWGFATGLWQRLPEPVAQVRLGLRGDALSGDRRAGDGNLNTFHPLFPNQTFFSNFSAFYPSNIYDVHPLVRAEWDPFGVEAGAVLFWRQSLEDAVFTPPGVATISPGGSRARFVGTQAAVSMKYKANSHVVLTTEYARIVAGPVIRNAAGRSVDFLGFWTSLDI